MQSPAVPTVATGALAMTPAAMAEPSLLEAFKRERRRESSALHVQRALGARAVGAELQERAAKLHV
eukprot:6538382-Alexandrium_andersonii.AAC.1